MIRKVRCWVRINGVLIPAIKTHVTRKSVRSADTFSASLAIGSTAKYGYGYAEWADFQPVDVTIVNQAGDSGPIDLVTGQVDTPVINWKDTTVGISGRDKSASLIEKRSSTSKVNTSISDVVQDIAQDHGLEASITSTDAIAGKTYNKNTVHLKIHKTDFEGLSDLAESVGYRWYVDGTTLVFEPKEQSKGSVSFYWYPPGVRGPSAVSNMLDLRTARNMTAAKPHNVKVKSWNHEKGKLVVGEANSGGVGDAINIEHHHNGRTQDQVDRIANSRLKNAIRHDCNVTISAVADFNVTARQSAVVYGTGTIYDQSYDIDSVDFDTGWGAGAVMDLECKAPKGGNGDSDGGGGGDDGDSKSDDTSSDKSSSGADVPTPPPRPAELGGAGATDEAVGTTSAEGVTTT